MATIDQRKSGWWQAKVRRKGLAPQSRTFRTRAEAEAWARAIEGEMDRGVFVSRAEAERTTLGEALTRYEREVSRQKKGAEQEKYRIRTWRADPLARRSLASLRGADFAAWRDARLAAGVAPATIRLDIALISHLYTIAEKEWSIHVVNPVQSIRLPRANNARERRLSPDEARYLLAALDDPGPGAGSRRNVWMPALVRLALETAMRQSELLALRWERVDQLRRVAHLPDTKNGTARDVPLSPAAVAVLAALPRSISGRVFDTTSTAVKQSWARAVARAQRNRAQDCGEDTPGVFLDDLTFHDLRHEATSRLAEKLQMHELMKVTGHKDTRMLARYYHPRAEDLARKLG